MTVIEIAAIRPPAANKKLATIVSETGHAFGIWPDKLGPLKVGGRYGIEFEELEFRGRPYRKITKVQPATETSRHKGRKFEERNARTNGHAIAAPASANAEQAFVATVLGAFVAAGRVGLDARELEQATTLVRSLWRVTFGGAHA
jgi:hypothetical protein